MKALDHNRPLSKQEIFMSTPAQEEALVDWFQDNALFYDKTSTDFKNHQKRERLVMEISNKLGLSVTSFLHWKTAMRTQ